MKYKKKLAYLQSRQAWWDKQPGIIKQQQLDQDL